MALAQVLEETGLEIDDMVRPDDMIEAQSDNKRCQLFIVSGLDPETATFAPQVQKVGCRAQCLRACFPHMALWILGFPARP